VYRFAGDRFGLLAGASASCVSAASFLVSAAFNQLPTVDFGIPVARAPALRPFSRALATAAAFSTAM